MARLDAMATSDGDQNVFNIARLLIGRSDASAVIRAAAIKEEIASVETGFAGLLDQMADDARETMTTKSEELSEGLTKDIDTLVRQDLQPFRSLLELSAQANLIAGLLNEPATTGDAARPAAREQ